MAKKNIDATSYDKRLTDRYVARGEFAPADLEVALNKLPDLEDMAENIADVVYASQQPTPEAPAE